MKQYPIYNDSLLTSINYASTINQASNKTIKPLDKLPYGQAWVISYYDNNDNLLIAMLQSYNTLVCVLDFSTGCKSYKINTSKTTSRHKNCFLKQFGYNPKFFK